MAIKELGDAGRFRMRTDVEPPGEAATDGSARAAELQTTLGRIRSMRRLTNLDPDPAARPAAWERRRLLRTVSLLLEAEGMPSSAAGEYGELVRTG